MAKWPYSTAAWLKLRRLKLQTSPLCEDCEAEGRTVPANVVDHRHAISQGGAPFPPLDGLASLCQRHHSIKTASGPEAGAFKSRGPKKGCTPDGLPLSDTHPWNGGNGKWSGKVIERRMPSDLKRSAIPLTIVCGPPGSGKTTYVRQHAAPKDVVICLDTIMQKISGLPEHQAPPHLLSRALTKRNAMLRSLANEKGDHAAFFIVSAPRPYERDVWARRLGGRLEVLTTPAIECIRRINADPARHGQSKRMVEAVLAWWRDNPHLERKISQGWAARTNIEAKQIVS
ncbi:AAA family ATPase [Porphyrobacter algicida]|uniref:AAA family ATPase n=1 Tax=Qipengyuania algicida TaxID=1836209 RepID=A0A845ACX6_9SPHN|nr:AAA family ATPase [Qipengyuania algicida]MXP28110.1 AAA family ATPase [Qipengyuania algicida]